MNTSSPHKDMDRREFLRRTTAGAGVAVGVLAAAAAAQEAKPPVERCDPHAPKKGRLLAPDEVIGLGMIGVGGMGGSHLQDLVQREKKGDKLQVRAICDVYERRKVRSRQVVKDAVGRDVDIYTDFREVLARGDIHGVVIATPDHWHAPISIAALEAGLDVYCQKPVTLTAEEALAVRDKVFETGRIFQCGAQGSSDDFWWQARQFIKDGGIGKVVWAQADYSRNSAGGPDDRGGEWNYHIDEDATDRPEAGEAHIAWEQWLGSAPKRPFSRPRFFQFRKYWDYSGGIATDLHYHVLAPLTIALDAQAPERACAAGGIFVQHDDREVPDTFMTMLDYPDDYTIVLTSSMANAQAAETIIRGHKATIRPTKKDDVGGMKVTAEKEFKEWFTQKYGAEEIFVPSKPRDEHMTNWLNCMRSREKPHLDAETACRAMIGIRMGVEAYRRSAQVFWDNARECYVPTHPRPDRKSFLPSEPEQA